MPEARIERNMLAQKMTVKPSEQRSIHPCEREHQAHYRAYLFGQFRVFHGKVSLGPQVKRRSKAGTLLKWFLLNPGKLGSADEFLDLFWPDISAETALCNFHVTMHYLRRLLQPELQAWQESKFIHRRANNFYWFEMDERWWTDAIEVQQLFDSARKLSQHGDDLKTAFYYRKVVSHCSQGFLPEDESEPWLEPYRRHFELQYLQALQYLMHLCLQRGELEDVMEYAYQALAVDAYCEPAIKAIIEVHLQQGNLPAASRTLNDFCTFCQQTLGVEAGKDFHLLRDRLIEAADSEHS